MLKLVAVTVAGGLVYEIVFTPISAKAADEPDKAAVQKATATWHQPEVQTEELYQAVSTPTLEAASLRTFVLTS